MRNAKIVLAAVISLPVAGCIFSASDPVGNGDNVIIDTDAGADVEPNNDNIVINNDPTNIEPNVDPNVEPNVDPNIDPNVDPNVEPGFPPVPLDLGGLAICNPPPTPFFVPGAAAPAINDMTVVATAEPARDANVPGPAGTMGSFAFAYATPLPNGGTSVYVSAGEVGEGPPQILNVGFSGGVTLNEVNEPWALSLTSYAYDLQVSNPAAVFSLLMATNAGVYECVGTIDDTGSSELDCLPSQLNLILGSLGLPAPARIDPAPVFTVGDAGKFTYSLSGEAAAIVPFTSPSGAGEIFAPFHSEDSLFTGIDLPEELIVDTRDEEPHPFMERAVAGVNQESKGFPYIAVLARNGATEPIKPHLLGAVQDDGLVYDIVSDNGPLDDWELVDEIDLARGKFSFLDAYGVDMDVQLLLTGATFDPGEIGLGYAGIARNGAEVILSLPGLPQDVPYFILPVPQAKELAAYRNIPLRYLNLPPDPSGLPVVAIVHGDERQFLGLLRWNLNDTGQWVANFMSPEFKNIRNLAPTWFITDRGSIPFVATRNGQPVIAILIVPNVLDLAEPCR